MKPLTKHRGRGVALRRSEVDTDQIIPAEYCKRLTKSGYADALFAAWRKDSHFVLNRPEYVDASILVAGHNFGTGSSREHAVWALRDWGFVVVIATSFGDIFLRNAFKNGLLAIELPNSAIVELTDLVEAAPLVEIIVDLIDVQISAGEHNYGFTVDERARWLLLNGFDEIATTLENNSAISAYEQTRLPWMPSIRPSLPVSAGNLPGEVSS